MAVIEIEPFEVHVPEQALADLRNRIANVRWPSAETAPDWSQGVPLAQLRDLCDHWLKDYDWRRCEAALNALPQFRTIIDGIAIHFLHVRSPDPDALPLILTHGWPGSVLEFLNVAGPLSDPAAHGAPGAQAFHLVIPSLPGYGFSDQPSGIGWGVERIAGAWTELMRRLDYRRFAAQGGDWGAAVTTAIAMAAPPGCVGIHLNMPLVFPEPGDLEDLTVAEQATVASMKYYQDQDSGYAKLQGTRPQTIGYALSDSPVGQAAWIYEKLLPSLSTVGRTQLSATHPLERARRRRAFRRARATGTVRQGTARLLPPTRLTTTPVIGRCRRRVSGTNSTIANRRRRRSPGR